MLFFMLDCDWIDVLNLKVILRFLRNAALLISTGLIQLIVI